MSKLIKHRTIMQAVEEEFQLYDGMIVYRQVEGDEGLVLHERDALDLGPVITVTVEPGDKLNEEEV